jgi:hypothetical protein
MYEEQLLVHLLKLENVGMQHNILLREYDPKSAG